VQFLLKTWLGIDQDPMNTANARPQRNAVQGPLLASTRNKFSRNRGACDKRFRRAHGFPAIQLELKGIQAPTARLPTRRDLAKAAVGIIFGAALVILWPKRFGINQPI
jgi:hypothetical protein